MTMARATLAPSITPLAIAVLVAALTIHLELLARLRRVDESHPPWWLGYARDAVNLSAALMLWGAYLFCSFSPPVAMCAAMLTTLAAYLLDWSLVRGLRVRRIRVALAIPLAAWVGLIALAPGAVHAALARLIEAVQPR